MKRRLIGAGLLLALAGLLGFVYRSDRLLFELPEKTARHQFEKIGHEMAKHHGVAFLMTFDEPQPVEWINRGPVLYPGTESVPGRFGMARRFDGRNQTHLSTAVTWPVLGSNYTLSLWIKLEPTGTDQEIWYNYSQQQHTGFKLINGRMTFCAPGKPDQAAAYPFEAFGRFVHLAGVVDSSRGEARLYENGELKAAVPVAAVVQPVHNLEFGKTRWYVVNKPLSGVLDESAAWTRALSPEEIRALARARQSLPRTLEVFPYWRWRLAQSLPAAIPGALRMLDRFNPWLHEGRAEAAALPEIQLHFSANDARHFMQAHAASLASGRRTARAANPRRIFAQYEGKTVEAQAWLDGSDSRYAPGRRPGFILETPADTPAFGSGRLRLVPPENLAAGLPGIAAAHARAGLDAQSGPGLCRLVINRQFKGIYIFESFDRMGLKPGDRSGVAKSSGTPVRWQRLFRPPPPADPLPADNLEVELARAGRLLVQDLFLPWSAREWTWRVRHCQIPANPEPAAPTPYAVLGGNPAPDYIVGDLDLRGAGTGSAGVVWHSSRPDVIDAEGHVTRPPGSRPVHVELSAAVPDGGSPTANVLRFRVMPEQPKLPALMLYIDEPLSNTRRTDFQADFHPVAGPPRRLAGGQATRGGIQHRGNTSYWSGAKKPFSLRFNEPHRLLGRADSPNLYLLNGYADPTRMRNKLVYDLFRACGDEHRPRHAPEIDWTEVFVNGEFLGVYEMCTRIDEDLLGFRPADNPAESPALYKIRAGDRLFVDAWTDEFDQVFPAPGKARHDRPMLDLVRMTSQPDAEQFVREIEAGLDLDNVIDFFLLLNFAGNVDGRTTNFYLARDGGPDARFFFIPWDYDHTFTGRARWLSNYLFDRLRSEFPGFRARTRRRWRELRQGPFTDAALEARIDEIAARLADNMDGEYVLIGAPVPPTFADHVADLKRGLHANLQYLDAKLNPAPKPAEPAP